MEKTIEQFEKEVINGIKNAARDYDIESLHEEADKSDTVTLYHGTNTFYLNRILKEGIAPRDVTGVDNWGHEAQSNEGIVYLTNKWHYWYAYHATEKILKDKYGEDWSSKPEAQWWLTFNPLPIYLECQVPKVYLTFDEDIVYSKFFKDKLKNAIKKRQDLNMRISWEESLSQSGTVGVRGGIPPEFIKSFTVLGAGQLYLDLMGDSSQYKKEFHKWAQGKGKGKMKKEVLKEKESKYSTIGTFQKDQIPKGLLISEFGFAKENKALSITLNTPEEYVQQPKNLERF